MPNAQTPAQGSLHDLAQLSGRFTENLLVERGYPREVIREAVHRGLLKPSVSGVLETIPHQFRENKLPKMEAKFAVGTPVTRMVPGPGGQPVAMNFVVTSTNGAMYDLMPVGPDGKPDPNNKVPVKGVQEKDIALAQRTPQEKMKAAAAAKAAPAAPSGGSPMG